MTKVVNLRSEPYDVRIDRGSLFGNPYFHGASSYRNGIRCRSREEAIFLYQLWLTTDLVLPTWRKPTYAQVVGLRGRRLGCWCAPLACHGSVLVEVIEGRLKMVDKASDPSGTMGM